MRTELPEDIEAHVEHCFKNCPQRRTRDDDEKTSDNQHLHAHMEYAEQCGADVKQESMTQNACPYLIYMNLLGPENNKALLTVNTSSVKAIARAILSRSAPEAYQCLQAAFSECEGQDCPLAKTDTGMLVNIVPHARKHILQHSCDLAIVEGKTCPDKEHFAAHAEQSIKDNELHSMSINFPTCPAVTYLKLVGLEHKRTLQQLSPDTIRATVDALRTGRICQAFSKCTGKTCPLGYYQGEAVPDKDHIVAHAIETQSRCQGGECPLAYYQGRKVTYEEHDKAHKKADRDCIHKGHTSCNLARDDIGLELAESKHVSRHLELSLNFLDIQERIEKPETCYTCPYEYLLKILGKRNQDAVHMFDIYKVFGIGRAMIAKSQSEVDRHLVGVFPECKGSDCVLVESINMSKMTRPVMDKSEEHVRGHVYQTFCPLALDMNGVSRPDDEHARAHIDAVNSEADLEQELSRNAMCPFVIFLDLLSVENKHLLMDTDPMIPRIVAYALTHNNVQLAFPMCKGNLCGFVKSKTTVVKHLRGHILHDVTLRRRCQCPLGDDENGVRLPDMPHIEAHVTAKTPLNDTMIYRPNASPCPFAHLIQSQEQIKAIHKLSSFSNCVGVPACPLSIDTEGKSIREDKHRRRHTLLESMKYNCPQAINPRGEYVMDKEHIQAHYRRDTVGSGELWVICPFGYYLYLLGEDLKHEIVRTKPSVMKAIANAVTTRDIFEMIEHLKYAFPSCEGLDCKLVWIRNMTHANIEDHIISHLISECETKCARIRRCIYSRDNEGNTFTDLQHTLNHAKEGGQASNEDCEFGKIVNVVGKENIGAIQMVDKNLASKIYKASRSQTLDDANHFIQSAFYDCQGVDCPYATDANEQLRSVYSHMASHINKRVSTYSNRRMRKCPIIAELPDTMEIFHNRRHIEQVKSPLELLESIQTKTACPLDFYIEFKSDGDTIARIVDVNQISLMTGVFKSSNYAEKEKYLKQAFPECIGLKCRHSMDALLMLSPDTEHLVSHMRDRFRKYQELEKQPENEEKGKVENQSKKERKCPYSVDYGGYPVSTYQHLVTHAVIPYSKDLEKFVEGRQLCPFNAFVHFMGRENLPAFSDLSDIQVVTIARSVFQGSGGFPASTFPECSNSCTIKETIDPLDEFAALKHVNGHVDQRIDRFDMQNSEICLHAMEKTGHNRSDEDHVKAHLEDDDMDIHLEELSRDHPCPVAVFLCLVGIENKEALKTTTMAKCQSLNKALISMDSEEVFDHLKGAFIDCKMEKCPMLYNEKGELLSVRAHAKEHILNDLRVFNRHTLYGCHHTVNEDGVMLDDKEHILNHIDKETTDFSPEKELRWDPPCPVAYCKSLIGADNAAYLQNVDMSHFKSVYLASTTADLQTALQYLKGAFPDCTGLYCGFDWSKNNRPFNIEDHIRFHIADILQKGSFRDTTPAKTKLCSIEEFVNNLTASSGGKPLDFLLDDLTAAKEDMIKSCHLVNGESQAAVDEREHALEHLKKAGIVGGPIKYGDKDRIQREGYEWLNNIPAGDWPTLRDQLASHHDGVEKKARPGWAINLSDKEWRNVLQPRGARLLALQLEDPEKRRIVNVDAKGKFTPCIDSQSGNIEPIMKLLHKHKPDWSGNISLEEWLNKPRPEWAGEIKNDEWLSLLRYGMVRTKGEAFYDESEPLEHEIKTVHMAKPAWLASVSSARWQELVSRGLLLPVQRSESSAYWGDNLTENEWDFLVKQGHVQSRWTDDLTEEQWQEFMVQKNCPVNRYMEKLTLNFSKSLELAEPDHPLLAAVKDLASEESLSCPFLFDEAGEKLSVAEHFTHHVVENAKKLMALSQESIEVAELSKAWSIGAVAQESVPAITQVKEELGSDDLGKGDSKESIVKHVCDPNLGADECDQLRYGFNLAKFKEIDKAQKAEEKKLRHIAEIKRQRKERDMKRHLQNVTDSITIEMERRMSELNKQIEPNLIQLKQNALYVASRIHQETQKILYPQYSMAGDMKKKVNKETKAHLPGVKRNVNEKVDRLRQAQENMCSSIAGAVEEKFKEVADAAESHVEFLRAEMNRELMAILCKARQKVKDIHLQSDEIRLDQLEKKKQAIFNVISGNSSSKVSRWTQMGKGRSEAEWIANDKWIMRELLKTDETKGQERPTRRSLKRVREHGDQTGIMTSEQLLMPQLPNPNAPTAVDIADEKVDTKVEDVPSIPVVDVGFDIDTQTEESVSPIKKSKQNDLLYTSYPQTTERRMSISSLDEAPNASHKIKGREMSPRRDYVLGINRPRLRKRLLDQVSSDVLVNAIIKKCQDPFINADDWQSSEIEQHRLQELSGMKATQKSDDGQADGVEDEDEAAPAIMDVHTFKQMREKMYLDDPPMHIADTSVTPISHRGSQTGLKENVDGYPDQKQLVKLKSKYSDDKLTFRNAMNQTGLEQYLIDPQDYRCKPRESEIKQEVMEEQAGPTRSQQSLPEYGVNYRSFLEQCALPVNIKEEVDETQKVSPAEERQLNEVNNEVLDELFSSETQQISPATERQLKKVNNEVLDELFSSETQQISPAKERRLKEVNNEVLDELFSSGHVPKPPPGPRKSSHGKESSHGEVEVADEEAGHSLADQIENDERRSSEKADGLNLADQIVSDGEKLSQKPDGYSLADQIVNNADLVSIGANIPKQSTHSKETSVPADSQSTEHLANQIDEASLAFDKPDSIIIPQSWDQNVEATMLEFQQGLDDMGTAHQFVFAAAAADGLLKKLSDSEKGPDPVDEEDDGVPVDEEGALADEEALEPADEGGALEPTDEGGALEPADEEALEPADEGGALEPADEGGAVPVEDVLPEPEEEVAPELGEEVVPEPSEEVVLEPSEEIAPEPGEPEVASEAVDES